MTSANPQIISGTCPNIMTFDRAEPASWQRRRSGHENSEVMTSMEYSISFYGREAEKRKRRKKEIK
jgi:hypothetical protein